MRLTLLRTLGILSHSFCHSAPKTIPIFGLSIFLFWFVPPPDQLCVGIAQLKNYFLTNQNITHNLFTKKSITHYLTYANVKSIKNDDYLCKMDGIHANLVDFASKSDRGLSAELAQALPRPAVSTVCCFGNPGRLNFCRRHRCLHPTRWRRKLIHLQLLVK